MNSSSVTLQLPSARFRRRPASGFTLIEVLVASTIIVLLCGLLIEMTSMTSKIWLGNKARTEQFQGSRNAFEAMTRRISQATLNTYWDYDKPTAATSAGTAPSKFIRQSELRFLCGETSTIVPTPARTWATKGIFFHAPLGFVDRSRADLRGFDNLLNIWGYFVEFGDDSETRPTAITSTIVPPRYRFRLMELMVPGDNLFTYSQTSGLSGTTPRNLLYSAPTWFSNFINVGPGAKPLRPVHVLAENVMALTFVPKLSRADELRRSLTGGAPLCPDYKYDSYYNPTAVKPDPEINPSNQLPPIVQVSMIAIDEASAAKMAAANGTTKPLYGTGLFTDTKKLFDDPGTPKPGDGDLAKFGQQLADQHYNYRVFTTEVTIRAARWSRDQ